MFKVLTKDDKANTIYIQGSYSKNCNADIASVVFQNYDNDTGLTYDMAKISMRDQDGKSNINGRGNLVFTNAFGDGNIYERMRITYDGKVGIGTQNPTESLECVGDICIRGVNRGLIFKNSDGSLAGRIYNSNGVISGVTMNVTNYVTSNLASQFYDTVGTLNSIINTSNWTVVSRWQKPSNIGMSNIGCIAYSSPHSAPYHLRVLEVDRGVVIASTSNELSNSFPMQIALSQTTQPLTNTFELQGRYTSNTSTCMLSIQHVYIQGS